MTVRDIFKSAAGLGTTVEPFTLYAWGNNQYGQIGNGEADYIVGSTVDTFLNPKSSPIQIGTLTNWSKISSGNDFSHAIKTDGTLWAWGNNTYGRLGTGNTFSRSSPVQVGSLTNWSKISSGEAHALAIKTDGTMWAWGWDLYGRLGIGVSGTNISSPIQVGTSTNWSSVIAGENHNFAIKTDNTLWTWGYNNYGQLGTENTASAASPVQVDATSTWKSASAGVNHSLAIKTDGTLWAWGYNNYGQLGLGFAQNTSVSSPIQVGALTNWSTVVAGQSHSLAIKTDGTLWVWGFNLSGRLGTGNSVSVSSPVQVGTLTNWSSASAAPNGAVIAVKTDGTLWAWGYNQYGRLGIGNTLDRNSPVQIGASTNWSDASISYHSLAIRGGTLYSWGANTNGQLGYPTNGTAVVSVTISSDKSSPVQIGTTNQWINFAYGKTHSAAIRANGSLWAWGNNESGQLGTGNTISRSSPVQVGTSTNWSMVSTGGFNFTLALTKNGTLWAWGANQYGQLGLNSTFSRLSPVQVGALSNWAYVNAGYDHTLAVKTDGTLWAWGYNNYWQLGLGNTSSYSSPVQVGALSNWLKAIGGHNTSAAIKTDGTLWTWGYNENGELGLSGLNARSSPVQVGTLNNWKDVSIGYDTSGSDHMIAVKTDGTIWAWGSNESGQLGVNNRINYSSPVQIGSSTDWSGVVAGQYHSMAVKTDGTLWAWGRNDEGQLGIGDIVSRSSPVQVGTLTNWTVNSAGITSAGGIF